MQKSLHNQTNDLFSKVASICSDKYKLDFNPISPMMNSKDKKNKLSVVSNAPKYEIVVPFPPTIYQMRKNYYETDKKNDSAIEFKQDLFGNKELNKDIKKELFDVEKEICINKANNDYELSKIYRLMGFKILNIFALNILKQTHPAQKVERIVERVIFNLK